MILGVSRGHRLSGRSDAWIPRVDFKIKPSRLIVRDRTQLLPTWFSSIVSLFLLLQTVNSVYGLAETGSLANATKMLPNERPQGEWEIFAIVRYLSAQVYF
jgi:hypothetical protein